MANTTIIKDIDCCNDCLIRKVATLSEITTPHPSTPSPSTTTLSTTATKTTNATTTTIVPAPCEFIF